MMTSYKYNKKIFRIGLKSTQNSIQIYRLNANFVFSKLRVLKIHLFRPVTVKDHVNIYISVVYVNGLRVDVKLNNRVEHSLIDGNSNKIY